MEAWLELLESIGCRMWFDAGLTLTNDWTEELASKISGSSFVFFFASKNSVKSKICNRELKHADRHGIKILPISLDGCELPESLEFMLDKQLVRDDIEPRDALAQIKTDLPAELFGIEAAGIGSDEQLRRIWFIASGRARKRRRALLTAMLAVAAVGLLALGLTVGRRQAATQLAAQAPAPADLSVYASAVMPYTQAGTFQTTYDLPESSDETLEASKAFSLVSFLENTGDVGALIEETRTDVLELEPIEEPVVRVDGGMADGAFYLFAVNDGWGAADTPFELAVTRGDTGAEVPLDAIIEEADVADAIRLQPLCVDRIARIAFDPDKFLANASSSYYGDAELTITVKGDGIVQWFTSYLIVYTQQDGFFVFWNGIGDGPQDYSITLFSLLDVDQIQAPQSIYFTGAESSPMVDRRYRVETVIAPTRSCSLAVRNVFTMDGEAQQTETYHVRVTVPVYRDSVVGRTGLLTRDLLQEPDASMMRLTQIAEPYRYDPESILEVPTW